MGEVSIIGLDLAKNVFQRMALRRMGLLCFAAICRARSC